MQVKTPPTVPVAPSAQGAVRQRSDVLDVQGVGGQFGIYIHYPQCRNRCGYCDFPTVDLPRFPQRGYADAVLAELVGRAGDYRALSLRSIYFGGGTPSLWAPEQIARVVEAARGRFDGAGAGIEITVEANPETLDVERMRGLREAGVNRLSIGVQALDDRTLSLLTRTHSAARAVCAVQQARGVGFESVSADLIFGFAGQTVADHLVQLERLLALEPDHVSTYALTLAPDAPLWRAGHRPGEGDRVAEMMIRGKALLEAAGLRWYEVSNYARPGHRSVHNALVWAGAPYLGLGASAHSALVGRGVVHRLANPPYARYRAVGVGGGPPAAVPGARRETVEGRWARFELLMLGLRTAAGLDRRLYRARFGGDPLTDFAGPLARLVEEGLVELRPDALCPSERGLLFADELALRLMP